MLAALRLFVDAIDSYLKRIEYAEDGYAALIRVPTYEHAQVVADPLRSFGSPPDLILDRSLGGIKVPTLLREAGLRLITLSEHYGKPADERVADTEWLELAGLMQWVVFMKEHAHPL